MVKQLREELVKEGRDRGIAVLLLVFTFFCGTNIPVARAANMSAGEYILLSLSNHYYIVYGLFLFFIFWTFRKIRSDSNIELVRYRDYSRYYAVRNGAAGIKIVIIVFMHVMIAAVLAVVNFGLSNEYSGHTLDHYYTSTLQFVYRFRDYFDSPLQATAAVCIYMAIGFLCIYKILFYTHKLFGDRITIICMCLILINVFIGFKTEVDESVLEVVFLNNYFLLHHSLFLNGLWAAGINTIIAFLVPSLLNRAVILKNRGKRTGQGSNSYLRDMAEGKLVISAAAVMILIGMNLWVMIYGNHNWMDFLFLNVNGFSKSNFYWKEFLSFISYFVIPIFMIGMFLEKEKMHRNTIGLFRYGSLEKWNRNVDKILRTYIVKYSILYVGLLLFSTYAAFFFNHSGKSDLAEEFIRNYGITSSQFLMLALFAAAVRGVELLILFEVDILIFRISGNAIVSFLMTGLGYLLAGSDIAQRTAYPFGSSALYNVLETVSREGIGKGCLYVVMADAGLLSILMFTNKRLWGERNGQCN